MTTEGTKLVDMINTTKGKVIWDEIIFSLTGPMLKNKEQWIYYHHGIKKCMVGKDGDILPELVRFKKQGLTKVDTSEVNDSHIHHTFTSKGKTYRADLTFYTYASDDVSPFCPILLGLSVIATGLTYIRVRYSEIK